jgi:hypothetical protein
MKRNPIAKALRTPKFKQKVVKNKKKYNRKEDKFKHTRDIDDVMHIWKIYD